MHCADMCVIFNPAAGRSQAGRRLAALRSRWSSRVQLQPTQYPGHAVHLARAAAAKGAFQIVAAAGGDGTVHEVANGLLEARRPEIQFGVIPLGSANDYHASLEMEPAPAGGGSRSVDVGIVRAPGGRQRYFVCCLGLGLNGAVNREARKIKRLQGIALYGLATLRALWYDYGCPRLELAIDDEPSMQAPTLIFSALVGRREGGFMMAPNASLHDGQFDFVHAGELSRWDVLRFLPRVALFGPPSDHPKVRLGRCRVVKLGSEAPLTVHVDGEAFCAPADDVRSLQIECVPGALAIAEV